MNKHRFVFLQSFYFHAGKVLCRNFAPCSRNTWNDCLHGATKSAPAWHTKSPSTRTCTHNTQTHRNYLIAPIHCIWPSVIVIVCRRMAFMSLKSLLDSFRSLLAPKESSCIHLCVVLFILLLVIIIFLFFFSSFFSSSSSFMLAPGLPLWVWMRAKNPFHWRTFLFISTFIARLRLSVCFVKFIWHLFSLQNDDMWKSTQKSTLNN